MPRRVGDHLAAVWRIARWEVSHTVGVADRRTVALAVVAVLLAGGVAGAAAAVGDTALDEGIYAVGVDSNSPYHDPVAASAPLSPVGPAGADLGEDVDVLIRDRDTSDASAEFLVADTRRGRAALSALRTAVTRYNDGQMAAESDDSAAFPVVVSVRYAERDDLRRGDGGSDGTATDDGTGGGDGTDGGSDMGGAAGGGSFGGSGADGSRAAPDFGGGVAGLFGDGTNSGSPADVQPPFPFSSLVLAFAFLVPLNFVVQAYGGTILDERVDRRGELLLVAPVGRGDIVAGKTLPYLAAALAAVAAVALAVGGGLLSVAAVAPVATLYLGAAFLAAMLARSFKELTFVTVTVSVVLTTYVFVPAIFAEVTPLALVSPLTLVVRDLEGAGAGLAAYAFSTGPFYAGSLVLFALGAGVYREEDMFTQRAVPLKFLDALDAQLTGAPSVALWSALFVPFAFMAELLGVAVLFVFPAAATVPVLLVVVAVVEEVVKSVHVYAGVASGRFERAARPAAVVGVASGVGFFLGEKLLVVGQLVGLPELALGRAVAADAGTGLGVSGVAAVGLLLAPLALHAGTAATTAVGATRGRRGYFAGLAAAVAIHVGYNLAVVGVIGGV
ncbi:MAG: PrsW family intramembrane metalloprotease [Halolamina sp.]